MSRYENVELTVLCLIYKEGKILLQNRVKSDWQGYALPGGHVEPGESVTHAVIREMREETGLIITNPQLCGIKQFPTKDGARYLVFLYKTDDFSGRLSSSSEGKMEWINRNELYMYPCVDDLEELLSVMESENLNEFQYVIRGGEWEVEIF